MSATRALPKITRVHEKRKMVNQFRSLASWSRATLTLFGKRIEASYQGSQSDCLNSWVEEHSVGLSNGITECQSHYLMTTLSMDSVQDESQTTLTSNEPTIEATNESSEIPTDHQPSTIENNTHDMTFTLGADGQVDIEMNVKKPPTTAAPGPCEQCHDQTWKYKCPRCDMRTCSLACVKQHKAEKECSGERSKTHFVPMKQYTERDMMSDYVYLEDTSRKSDTLTRERLRAFPENNGGKHIDSRIKHLVRQARQLGINFDVLPTGMSRAKSNTSNYSSNKKQIYWSIECIFCHKDRRERILDHSIPSGMPLRSFFENMLFSERPIGKTPYSLFRHQVQDFVDAGMGRYVIGLKKEGLPKKSFVNITSYLDKPINESLRGERIIEFPTLYIWLEGNVEPEIELLDKEEYTPKIADKPKGNRNGEKPAEEVAIQMPMEASTEEPPKSKTQDI
ncbi:hypothetical protein PHYBLDRAFT_172596 [Phycomyces blakesleeanus NRRL 1555(-)]|uniref:Box C/D snoRNA protein 1 n=2 Tax=Phycomyces blakesleeanus TaxID=4837 RepID=A0A162NGB6_PHYB8|nr:hypothetical protein PHYBLDRAFT_172596 [Phycomyces blakesleeanus NRRL 1555(-)]OAD69344.1 hypothetical protein PHYBLDRAFT_172596 [Phycomyces blakesleeanus NRRL 1555(-)]|eukprot:XP_018287384.1 hypothetical protein PHYBLDRAFT_172596 [Phycomyces blakesleeanus NRRL 1555(-)]